MAKKVVAVQPHDKGRETPIFELRGYLVMLASRVAEVFNVETREIVQNIRRNNVKRVKLGQPLTLDTILKSRP